jgi:ABC-type glycerol-3-phosphate transport system permease component
MSVGDAATAPSMAALRRANSPGISRLIRRGGTYALTIALVIFAVFPLYWMVVNALSRLGASRSTNQPIWPETITFENFIYVFTQVPLGLWLLNSAIVATIAAATATFVGAMAGYSLSRFRFRWTGLFVTVIVAAQLMPPTSIIIPLYRMALLTDLVGTRTGLIFAHLADVLPIAIFLLRGFFLSIPREIEEAALTEGASQTGVLLHVVMPLAAPGLATVFIYAFVVSWNDLLFARTLASSSKVWTAPVGLASFSGEYYTLFEPLMAAALIFALPVTVVFLILQRHFVHGLTVGGIK